MEMRAEIAKKLGQTIINICRGHGSANMFEDIMEDFRDAAEFVDYFKSVWFPRIGGLLFYAVANISGLIFRGCICSFLEQ